MFSNKMCIFVTMDNNVDNQSNNPDGVSKPIRWVYVVVAIIVIAIVVLAEMFHPRSTRNQIKAYEAQIEAQQTETK